MKCFDRNWQKMISIHQNTMCDLLKNIIYCCKRSDKKVNSFCAKKSGVALTQLSLTLDYSRRIFYYQRYIHI